jgi:hypothetical protein
MSHSERDVLPTEPSFLGGDKSGYGACWAVRCGVAGGGEECEVLPRWSDLLDHHAPWRPGLFWSA